MAKKEKQPEWVDRILNPQKYPYIVNKDKSVSTHRMAAEVDENGNWYVFPTIVPDGKGGLKELDNMEAFDYALSNKQYMLMPSKEEAIEYAKGGYKKGTPLETFNPLKQRANTAKTFVEALQ